jgi:hypothetical protein
MKRGAAKKKKIRVCPKCGSSRVAPIVYGLPGWDLAEDERKGLVVLGGCCVGEGDPIWACFGCDHRWGYLKLS